MRLSAKILKNVANINQYEWANQAYIQEGQSNEFYIQLVDLDKTPIINKSDLLPEAPLRYIPQGSTINLDITFPAIRHESDDSGKEEFTVTATQPFSDDKSIWKISLTSDQLPKAGNITGKLTVDGNDKFFLLVNAINVKYLQVGDC